MVKERMIVLDPSSVAETTTRDLTSLPVVIFWEFGSRMLRSPLFTLLVGIAIGWSCKSTSTSITSTSSGLVVVDAGNSTALPWPSSEDYTVETSTSSSTTLHQLTATRRKKEAKKAAASVASGTRVVSDFIQDFARVLKPLTDTNLWMTCAEQDPKWITVQDTPTDLWQQLAHHIWHPDRLAALGETDDSIAGVEYWCSVLKHDENNKVWEFTQQPRPLMSALYFGYPHQVKGGLLQILPLDQEDQPDDPNHPLLESFQPQYNRLILYNVSQWHRTTPVQAGARFAFGVNLWKEKPLNLQELPSTTEEQEL